MSIFRKNPPLTEITLVSMFLATSTQGTCCTSQLNKFITEELRISPSYHKRAIYVPMTNLCKAKMIRMVYVDTEEESMLMKKGRRKHYVLTREGRKEVLSLYNKNKEFYDENIPFSYYNCIEQLKSIS